ncbi:MAG: hypothetical protein MJH10_20135, partial [Epibacterium sp.]|nr:hypothetical protein [Epibacterium sp.]NQX75784.1 hypothetical protein [Epibacterium sp.]
IIENDFDRPQRAQETKRLVVMAMAIYFAINKDPEDYQSLLRLALSSKDKEKAKGTLMAIRNSFDYLGTEYVQSVFSILKNRSDVDLYREALTGLLKLSESTFNEAKNDLQETFREGIASKNEDIAFYALTYMDFLAQRLKYDRTNHVDQITLILSQKENDMITWKAIQITEKITGRMLTNEMPDDKNKESKWKKENIALICTEAIDLLSKLKSKQTQ